jgi:hypothetical protein
MGSKPSKPLILTAYVLNGDLMKSHDRNRNESVICHIDLNNYMTSETTRGITIDSEVAGSFMSVTV